jgi:tRNA-modifying protein YgfZ
MPTAHLEDRGVVKVSGPEAGSFLDGLVTCDIDRVSTERARFGALLTPQGKILFDFIVFRMSDEAGDTFFLDCRKAFTQDLARRLGFYKLRAKVTVEDLSETLCLIAGWEGAPPASEAGLVSADPRLAGLGWRAIVAASDVAEFTDASAEAYHAHRIATGVPEGGTDFVFGQAFPHEALMDQLSGVDFDKGCYVGQEVVSRMQHRGTARTRIVPVVYSGDLVPELGADVTAGERTIGQCGSSANCHGLVMIRLDRAADAVEAKEPLRAGGVDFRLIQPEWLSFAVPGVDRNQMQR